MLSIFGILCCAVACAYPLSQALVVPSRPRPLIHLLHIALLASPVHGVDVHGRDLDPPPLHSEAPGFVEVEATRSQLLDMLKEQIAAGLLTDDLYAEAKAQAQKWEGPVESAGHSARRDTGSSTFSKMLAHASALVGGSKVNPVAKQMTNTTPSSFSEATEGSGDDGMMKIGKFLMKQFADGVIARTVWDGTAEEGDKRLASQVAQKKRTHDVSKLLKGIQEFEKEAALAHGKAFSLWIQIVRMLKPKKELPTAVMMEQSALRFMLKDQGDILGKMVMKKAAHRKTIEKKLMQALRTGILKAPPA